MCSIEEKHRELAAESDSAAEQPLFSRYMKTRADATEHRLKMRQWRSDTMTILEKSRHVITQSLILIVQVDHQLGRDETFLRGGHAGRAVFPMLAEIREQLTVARREAIECGKRSNSATGGVRQEWLDLEQ